MLENAFNFFVENRAYAIFFTKLLQLPPLYTFVKSFGFEIVAAEVLRIP